MATPKETQWELEPHTRAKHEILRLYLQAWFRITVRRFKRVVYVDGFCGPGQYEGGEPGSPLIALDAAPDEPLIDASEIVFWFVDEEKKRIEQLQDILQSRLLPRHYRVEVETGKFHEHFEKILNSIEGRGEVSAPAFAFLDPFGFSGIPLRLIQQLLSRRSCEVFINFMADSVNRWVEHPKPKVRQHIVDLFGTRECQDLAALPPGERQIALKDLYQRQLLGSARFVRYFEMRGRRDRTQYYLFFATNDRLGHVKMKDAMWKVDPDGDFRFSDATNPNQLVLFETDHAVTLAEILHHRFASSGSVTAATVLRYVEDETPFLKKHMRAALKREEKAGGVIVAPLKTDGTKRRAGTYPDTATLSFASV